MSTLPRASVSVNPTAAAPGGGTDLVCILSPCATLDDCKPRLFGSAAAIVSAHGYSEGAEYAAMHTAGTGKPVLFVGMPIGTAGAISRTASPGNTGSSVVTVTAGGDGVLAEHDGQIVVVAGGTIGTDQIKLNLSLDGGRTFQPIRLGTSNSFAIPNVNATVGFGAGTLVTGDTCHEWHGSGPKISTADLATVRTELAAKQFRFRSALLTGDLPNNAAALALATQVNAYATSNDRHIYARASVLDRLPRARLSHVTVRMTGTPTLTFDTTADTVTRSGGSWVSEGWAVGDTITFDGSTSNDITTLIVSVDSATQITVLANLVNEGPVSDMTAVGGPTLTFAASGDTITRNRGSWITDGFRVADSVDITDTASNNVTLAAVTVTALVLTLADGLANETIGSAAVSVTAGETKAEWMARIDAEFASIDGQPRIDLSAGRGGFISPYSGWLRRVPAGWLASVREYQHDLHITTWQKDLGPLGADLFDAEQELVEWDARVDAGGLEARFTCLRTWANGPSGAFVAQSLTRAGDGQIASLTNQEAVINHVCNTVQLATENFIGRSPTLNADGTLTKDELNNLQSEVNAVLEQEILSSRGEGPRASRCVWSADPADVYTTPEPVTHGSVDLGTLGVIHTVVNVVRVNSNAS